jgi:hypothetical protein
MVEKKEYMNGITNGIYFCPMLDTRISGKMHHFYWVLLQESPFFYFLDQIWVHLPVKPDTHNFLGLEIVFEVCYNFVW